MREFADETRRNGKAWRIERARQQSIQDVFAEKSYEKGDL